MLPAQHESLSLVSSTLGTRTNKQLGSECTSVILAALGRQEQEDTGPAGEPVPANW